MEIVYIISKEMISTDDPTRMRLCHEVRMRFEMLSCHSPVSHWLLILFFFSSFQIKLLFKEEGGAMNITFSFAASASTSVAESN